METSQKGSATAPFLHFAEVAERLLDNGYAPLPVAPGGKAVLLRNWQQHCRRPPSLGTVAKWMERFPDHGTGAATGFLIGIDIDFLDPAKADQAARSAAGILGDTPLKRIGQAPKVMHFFRAAEPFATIKRDGAEVLSLGRQAVLFHIHPDTGQPYRWIDESPLDVPLDELPLVTEGQCQTWISSVTTGLAERVPQCAPFAGSMLQVGKGFRHDTLFPLVRKAGMAASSEDGLLREAANLNAGVCHPPLPESQIKAMVRGVWRWRERGTLWSDDGQARALLAVWEFDALADQPDAVALLMLLKLNHGARDDFVIVPDAMANARLLGDWGKKSYMALRDVLLERGFIIRTHEGGGRGNPHRYRLADPIEKGALRDHNIKEIPPFQLVGLERRRTLVQVRYDLDGSVTVTTDTTTERLLFSTADLPLQPTQSEILRQQARAAFRAQGRGAQSRAAEAIGVTRGQIASFLVGRYGLNDPAERALRELVAGGNHPKDISP